MTVRTRNRDRLGRMEGCVLATARPRRAVLTETVAKSRTTTITTTIEYFRYAIPSTLHPSHNSAFINFAMASQLKNLPPEVRRELLRHVRPRTVPSTSGGRAGRTATTTNSKTYWPLVVGCTAFVGFGASLPYWATQTIGNLTDRDEPLTAAQVRRGAFLNSGTHDAGKDPNWDWKNGQYIYPKGFAEHLKGQNRNETDLGPDIGPMVLEEKKRRS